MCSLSCTMMRRYMPSTVTVLSSMLTLRWRSPALAAARAVATAARERFNQSMTSAFGGHGLFHVDGYGRLLGSGDTQQIEVGDGDVHVHFADGAHPGAGRQANFCAGVASASAISCRETWPHSPS